MKSNFSYTIYTILFTFILIGQSQAEVNDFTLNARIYLEGALLNAYETGETHNRPLMRDDLRDNPFNNQRSIPDQDIYKIPHETTSYVTVDLTSKYTHVGCGEYPQYESIYDPGTVFSVTGENAIVDWVFVELRDKNNSSIVVATRSGLVQRDGDIVDIDGVSPLSFIQTPYDSYFVAIRHRNHLGVMTKYAMTIEQMEELVDFTTWETPLYDKGDTGMFDYTGMAMKSEYTINQEVRMLWAGDLDGDGKVIFHGKMNDVVVIQKEVAGFDILTNPLYKVDFDGAVGYLQGDYDMNGKAKFDSPGDDTNYVLAQVFFYTLNESFLNNFAKMEQQLPE